MHIREKKQEKTSGVIEPQKGDILILIHAEYDDFPIHAMALTQTIIMLNSLKRLLQIKE